jgi:hypothetical protein
MDENKSDNLLVSAWRWVVKYSGNIFSVIGIGLTIFFGAFYVPDALREAELEKVKNAQINIVQSFKELAYADSTFNSDDVHEIYDAEQIRIGTAVPLSETQLLTATQGAFMADKFLPLKERKRLLQKIESVKRAVDHQAKSNTSPIVYKAKADFWAWLSPFIALIVSIVGAAGVYYRTKHEKANQEEINNEVEFVREGKQNGAYHYEEEIKEILNEIPGIGSIKQFGNSDYGFDLSFTYRMQLYFIEVKYLRTSKVGINSFKRFYDSIKGNEGNFWFIYNTDLTPLVKTAMEEIKVLNTPKRKIHFLHLPVPEMLRERLPELLKIE